MAIIDLPSAQDVQDLTAAIIALSASLAGGLPAGTSAPAATDKKPPAKPKASADKPKFTRDEVNAAITKIKDDFGLDAAKEKVVVALGYTKMSEIEEKDFTKAVELANKVFEELTAAADAGEAEPSDDL